MPDPATLVWLNRPEDVRAYVWHVAAPGARVITVDEVGPYCSVRVETPARLLVSANLPAAVSLTRDDAELRAAVKELFAGAARPRVLAVGRVDRSERWRAILAALDPEAVDLPRSLPPPDGFVAIEAAAGSQDGRLFAPPNIVREVRSWLWRVEAGRASKLAFHPVADLLATGFLAPHMEGGHLVRRTGAVRRCAMLVPGGSEQVAGAVLELASATEPLNAALLRIRVDGVEATVRIDSVCSCIRAELPPVTSALCHRVEIFRDATQEFSLASVGLEPA